MSQNRLPVLALLLPLLVGASVLAGGAEAAIEIEGSRAITLGWGPADGPVAGYAVFVSKNGKAFPTTPNKVTVPTNRSAAVKGKVGETLRIRIAAFDENGNYGPASEASDFIRFRKKVSAPIDPPPTPPAEPDPVEPPDPVADGPSNRGCGAIADVSGDTKVKLGKGGSRKLDADLTISFCNGQWRLAGDDTVLFGNYNVLVPKRKFELLLDDVSFDRLVNLITSQSAGLAEDRKATWITELPHMRLKFNKDGDRMKLRVEAPLLSSIDGERTKGRYNVRAGGSLE